MLADHFNSTSFFLVELNTFFGVFLGSEDSFFIYVYMGNTHCLCVCVYTSISHTCVAEGASVRGETTLPLILIS